MDMRARLEKLPERLYFNAAVALRVDEIMIRVMQRKKTELK